MAPDPARVRQIAAMLRDRPGTFGRPASDRTAWGALARTETMRDYVTSKEGELTRPVVPMTEEEFGAAVVTGSRPTWRALEARLGNRLKGLVFAECLENKGRFVAKTEELLEALFLEKTWIATVRKAQATRNWYGQSNNIDLGAARRSWEVALADYLLGDRLSPAMRLKIREQLEHRTFGPFRRMVTGEQKPDFWLTTTSNWNAVCLAGVTGAALTILDSKDQRAYVLAAAEKHSRNFLAGFPPDGYCTEGLGYYNYGFGHYLALSEAAWQVTEGRLDLFGVPQMRSIALFPVRMEIMNGVYPSIADCPPGARPARMLMDYTSRRLGLGLKHWETDSLGDRIRGSMALSLMQTFPNAATTEPAADITPQALDTRSFFDHAGILICRPAVGAKTRLGVCLKGGHNAEHHNHNDVGTFVVAVDTDTPVSDAGAEVYTHQTFSAQRYESDALNSYGHSVPFVAGTMQSKGRQAKAVVLRADFTDAVDTFTLDLASCYEVPTLRKLKRTFLYSRGGEGSLAVTDEVAYSSPQAFETALITLGSYKIISPDTVLLFGRESAALAKVASDTGSIRLRGEVLKADLRIPTKATRIAIGLSEPAEAARITVWITPAAHPDGRSIDRIHNGSFEEGDVGWTVPKENRMCEVLSECPASGQKSLKVVDNDPEAGSSRLSLRMRAEPDGLYRLCGKIFPVSGSADGLGIYARFYDGADEVIRLPREERLKSIVITGGETKQWRPFAKTFRTTRNTRYMRIWIHSMSATCITAYLDDLEIVEGNTPEDRE
ncbi:MAG: hypothetical protein HN742_40240 [Lentisphaerae bacterium]|nr:hypothetical protein [Lentisphaerota bacterium]MBT7848166.1 hypothetical protein [Lentisphaerota bacterium]